MELSFKSYTILAISLLNYSAISQVNAYYNSASFTTPDGKSFVETSLTIADKQLGHRKVSGGYQHAVSINCVIKKDSVKILSNRYNLLSPVFQSTTTETPFIDVQRYPLKDGIYELEITLADKTDDHLKPLVIRQSFTISYDGTSPIISSIQPVESFTKAKSNGPLTKSGYDLVPYNAALYPDEISDLKFYAEAYRLSAGTASATTVLFKWQVEDESGESLPEFGGFSRQKAAEVNPVLARLNIAQLTTGNYRLVLEVRNDKNELICSQRMPFARQNRALDPAWKRRVAEREEMARYFGRCDNTDTLKMFVECLWPIAGSVDKERIINHAIKHDHEIMKKFIIDFWERRAGDSANPLNLWATYYRQVQLAMVNFKCGKQPGYFTDRGRVFLQYGPPSQRSQQNMEANTYPYEIWHYYRLTDATNNQFYSNRKFVFVNRNMGDDCFKLAHSDMRGEINNPRWLYEVSRLDPTGIGNPDQTAPSGLQNNNINDLYTSPR